ncbi:BrnT family toxin [Phyllobacterium sp. P5_D12]
MKITFDPVKRDITFQERGLDFGKADIVFAGRTYDKEDDRFDYGEIRVITVGYLHDRMVVIVWTERDGARHIISMRKANERERNRYKTNLG